MLRKFILTFFVAFGMSSVAITLASEAPQTHAKRDGQAEALHHHASRKCGAHWDYIGNSYQYHYIQC